MQKDLKFEAGLKFKMRHSSQTKKSKVKLSPQEALPRAQSLKGSERLGVFAPSADIPGYPLMSLTCGPNWFLELLGCGTAVRTQPEAEKLE